MNYIVLDMEWNQAYQNSKRVFIGSSRRVLTGEVIQIGAVKLNDKFEITDTFTSIVKPSYYRKLHYKVEKLTGIKKSELESADNFSSVFNSFMDWCGEDTIFIIWGFDDIDILNQNIEINNCGREDICWYNLQLIYSKQCMSANQQVALSAACEHFGIPQDKQLHNALNDAYYTACVCGKLDMVSGLEYCKKQKKQAEENCRKKYKYYGFFSINEALDYSTTNDDLCPVCQRKLHIDKKHRRKGLNQYVAVLSCPQDGTFFSKICIIKESENHFKVTKTVCRITPQLEKLYLSNKPRRRHRAKKDDSDNTKTTDN